MAVFSDTTNQLGIVEKIDFLLFGTSTANTTEYPLKDKAREVNDWYRRIMAWIFQAAGNWSFDDSNYTDRPLSKNNVTSRTQNYSFPTDYVEIEEIHYKDVGGIWHKLIPLDRRDIAGGGGYQSGQRGGISNLASEEFYKTNGTPIYYDKFANGFDLYPAPDRTSTDADSLRIYFTRDASLTGTTSGTAGPFVSTDTTKVPGFNRMWHMCLAYGAAYNYCVANVRTDKISILSVEIENYHQMILDHYARRKKDERGNLQPRYQSNK